MNWKFNSVLEFYLIVNLRYNYLKIAQNFKYFIVLMVLVVT